MAHRKSQFQKLTNTIQNYILKLYQTKGDGNNERFTKIQR